MSTILITGGTGLVGSHLLPLFGPEDEVHVLARSAPASIGDVAARLHHHPVDLSRGFDDRGLPKAVDAVICLAQSENFRAFPETALDVFDVNVSGLMRLLDYARRAGARSFVSASSGGVYGSSPEPVREDAAIAGTGQNGFYLSTKLCGEILAENYAPFMNVAILRLFFCYGRGQRRSMLVPRLIDTVRDGRPVALQGEDGIRINPVHARDAAAACKAALDARGLIKVNVAGPETLSIRDIARLISSKVGREPVFDVKPGSPDLDLIADIAEMTKLAGPPRRRMADHLEELL